MPEDTPMDQLATLARLLREAAEVVGVGLELRQVAGIPDLDGGPAVIQAVFVIPAEEDPLIGIMRATEEAEDQQRTEEAIKQIEDTLNGDGGIL